VDSLVGTNVSPFSVTQGWGKIPSVRILAAAAAAAGVMVAAVCGSNTAKPAQSPTSTPVSPCNLQPSDHALILWERVPRLPDDSTMIGDVDLSKCKPTLETWRNYQPTGPGYCTKIAWADDNPGYPVESRPSPPLKKVIDEVGDC
jgi:hypothetical protein